MRQNLFEIEERHRGTMDVDNQRFKELEALHGELPRDIQDETVHDRIDSLDAYMEMLKQRKCEHSSEIILVESEVVYLRELFDYVDEVLYGQGV